MRVKLPETGSTTTNSKQITPQSLREDQLETLFILKANQTIEEKK